MRLVIDCNVFVSAALGSKPCQKVIEKALLNCDIFYSDTILREIREAFLKPKLNQAKAEGELLLEKLEIAGMWIDPQPCSVRLPDPDDEIYLDAALHVGADAIITGNAKHFPEKLCKGVHKYYLSV